MQVVQNEDEVKAVDDNGNKFLNINPGYQKYALGDLDEQSSGTRIEIDDAAGTQEVKVYGFTLVVPKVSETSFGDFQPESGSIIFNTTTNKFQGWDGTSWIEF